MGGEDNRAASSRERLETVPLATLAHLDFLTMDISFLMNF